MAVLHVESQHLRILKDEDHAGVAWDGMAVHHAHGTGVFGRGYFHVEDFACDLHLDGLELLRLRAGRSFVFFAAVHEEAGKHGY